MTAKLLCECFYLFREYKSQEASPKASAWVCRHTPLAIQKVLIYFEEFSLIKNKGLLQMKLIYQTTEFSFKEERNGQHFFHSYPSKTRYISRSLEFLLSMSSSVSRTPAYFIYLTNLISLLHFARWGEIKASS